MTDNTADMLNKIPGHGANTGTCLTCAKRIAALLKDMAEAPEENTEQSTDSTDSDSNETQGSPHTIQPHAHSISQTARNQLRQLINSQAGSLPQALGERLAKKLNALHQDSPHDSLKVAVLGTHFPPVRSPRLCWSKAPAPVAPCEPGCKDCFRLKLSNDVIKSKLPQMILHSGYNILSHKFHASALALRRM